MKDKVNNTGGRPSKKAFERKKYQLCLKLKTEEEYLLRALCKKASLSKQEFIRQCLMSSNVVPRITPEISDLIRKLSGMANNLNQIARKANQAGYSGIRSEYLFLADKIDTLINSIRHDSKNITRE